MIREKGDIKTALKIALNITQNLKGGELSSRVDEILNYDKEIQSEILFKLKSQIIGLSIIDDRQKTIHIIDESALLYQTLNDYFLDIQIDKNEEVKC